MAHNQIHIFFAKFFLHHLGDVFMTRPVKTIFPHPVFLVPFHRHRIHILHLRNRLVKRRVKHRHLRRLRQSLLHRMNSRKVSWVVQRRKLRKFLNIFNHLVRNHYRFCIFFAPMYHAVSHASDFFEFFHYPVVQKLLEHYFYRLGMVLDFALDLVFLALVLDGIKTVFRPNLLHITTNN